MFNCKALLNSSYIWMHFHFKWRLLSHYSPEILLRLSLFKHQIQSNNWLKVINRAFVLEWNTKFDNCSSTSYVIIDSKSITGSDRLFLTSPIFIGSCPKIPRSVHRWWRLSCNASECLTLTSLVQCPRCTTLTLSDTNREEFRAGMA